MSLQLKWLKHPPEKQSIFHEDTWRETCRNSLSLSFVTLCELARRFMAYKPLARNIANLERGWARIKVMALHCAAASTIPNHVLQDQELSGEGTDTVISDINWTLQSNVENLILTGLNAINGTGNSINNLIIGNNADNILNGGTGTDTLQGNQGSDILPPITFRLDFL